MLMEKLKYSNYDIVFQEVPGETTLSINITECPHHCVGCHSQYLAESIGNFLEDDIDELLNKYSGLISCVCLMGGDQKIDSLNRILKKIKLVYGLKTCVYSGNDNMGVFHTSIQWLDYLKIGHYEERLGGLDSKFTNQKFYRIQDRNFEDITHIFLKR